MLNMTEGVKNLFQTAAHKSTRKKFNTNIRCFGLLWIVMANEKKKKNEAIKIHIIVLHKSLLLDQLSRIAIVERDLILNDYTAFDED